MSALLAGCWWQQPGFGPEHSRHNPFERELRPANVATAAPQWSVTVPGTPTEPGTLSEPVTSRDLVFSKRQLGGNAASVQAFEIDSGDVAWEHTLPPPGFSVGDLAVPVAFSRDELRVGHIARFPFGSTPCGDLTRLDPETGDVLGVRNVEFPTSAVVSAATITAQMESTRCTGGFASRLVVRDRATSDVLWSAASFSQEVMVPPTIAVTQGRIYVSDHGTIHAFDIHGCGAATCTPVWSFTSTGFDGPVIAAGDDLVFAFETGRVTLPPPDPNIGFGIVRALSAGTGAEVWRAELGGFDPGDDGQVSGIAAAGDTLYVAGSRQVASGAGTLEAYAADGCGQPECAPLWSGPLAVSAAGAAAWPAVAGDLVYATSPDGLVAFDAQGCTASPCAPLATIPLDDAPARHLSVSAGHMLAVTSDGAGSQTLTALALP
jgi:outer membrane protein assembly factor BamB